MLEQFGFALAPRTHLTKSLFSFTAYRKDVIWTGEDVDFTDPQFTVDNLDHLQYDENRVIVLLDLRTLVALPRVLDRELVQAEFMLHGGQLSRARILECNPDEA